MPRALKVFRTPVGFFDAVVAAPSQKAALKAWGARGDLFAIGEAHVVEDPDLVAEALARPGEIIRKPRGDEAALVAAAKRPPAKAASKRPSDTPKLKKPDRAELKAAEAELAEAERRHAREIRALVEAREEAERAERLARQAAEKALAKLRRKRDDALAAYEAAGEGGKSSGAA